MRIQLAATITTDGDQRERCGHLEIGPHAAKDPVDKSTVTVKQRDRFLTRKIFLAQRRLAFAQRLAPALDDRAIVHPRAQEPGGKEVGAGFGVAGVVGAGVACDNATAGGGGVPADTVVTS